MNKNILMVVYVSTKTNLNLVTNLIIYSYYCCCYYYDCC